MELLLFSGGRLLLFALNANHHFLRGDLGFCLCSGLIVGSRNVGWFGVGGVLLQSFQAVEGLRQLTLRSSLIDRGHVAPRFIACFKLFDLSRQTLDTGSQDRIKGTGLRGRSSFPSPISFALKERAASP